MDQWNGIMSPEMNLKIYAEMNPKIYGQLSFDK